jgi:hypothetical protein
MSAKSDGEAQRCGSVALRPQLTLAVAKNAVSDFRTTDRKESCADKLKRAEMTEFAANGYLHSVRPIAAWYKQ